MRRIAARERQIETLRARMPDVDAEPIDEDDDEMMIVWAHDLNVEPGRTYRYRVIVDFYNPFFARRLNLIEDQQHLADEIVISSQAAAWSEPITARPPLHPFVTRAYSPSQEPGSVSSSHSTGHAIVEVYRFYDGRWWQSQFNVEPGQRVGGPREEGGQVLNDYGTEWFVLDILEDADWEGREGRAARVMLQNINSGEILEVRHPRTDLDDPLRRRLSDEARAAGTS